MKAKSSHSRYRGFALIITLSLMVLLTIIVVGLLSLSSISLRASAQGKAMATARSNARLALMLALGELQRSAGPDQRVTARADIGDENVTHPQLTGVWESSEVNATAPPQAADYKKPAKDAKFRAWLVSHSDPLATREASFASQVLASPVTLWDKGTLGDKALTRGRVTADKVPLVASPGALAWAVLDEGVKARINTPYVDAATTVGAKTMQLGAGERPGTEFIDGLSGLQRTMFQKGSPEFATIQKGVSRLNYALAAQNLAEGTREALQAVTHDVTTQSVGLFTDTARGGLKQDFQLLTNSSTLPEAYQGKGVYASLLKMKTGEVVSDPTWASLHQFIRLYRDKVTSTAGAPVLKAQWPSAWVAASKAGNVTTVNRKPPPGVVLLPTIAKVQVLFSLIGRDLYGNLPARVERELTVTEKADRIHGPQCDEFANSRYNYDLHLLYTPIVTLHNPYNVAIDCSNIRVEFVHVPFAMQIFRKSVGDSSFEAQSRGMVPLQTMTADNDSGQEGKVFGMNLKSKSSSGQPDSTTFRMLPGEVRVFSAYLDPNRTYQQDLGDRKFWDIYLGSGLTTNMDAIPGWRGNGIGYDCDWVAGNQIVDTNGDRGHWGGCLGIAWNDEIYVNFTPYTTFPSSVSDANKNKFIIQMTATPSGSTTQVCTGAIEFDYESPNGLHDFILGKGSPPLRYPKTGTVRGVDLVDRARTPIKELKNVKPFCLLSAQAKTTSGGRDASNEDGRIATKPWCFGHANAAASSQRVVTEHSANHSHEIDLQRLDVLKGSSNLVQVDIQDRGNFISGHTSFNGTKFGGQYDIPLTPIQNFASLNGANPGGSSGYLPRFAQPIGNSWAHPLIAPGKLMETKTGGNYLDHSFLLNLAFYDSFYFSGLAAQTGPFAGGKSTAVLAEEFAADKPLDDPRLLLHRPNALPATALADEVAKTDAYTRIAAWQLMEGPFNINSTSVLAWKAMLASIHDSQALINQISKGAPGKPATSKLTPLTPVGKEEARISRFRLPAATSAADGAELKDGYWLGPREYPDDELQKLAENIVKQVRLRGPFLSMAEFVNRRLDSDESAQRGALQQAIDDANINSAFAVAANAGFEIPAATVAKYKYVNPAAGTGSSYQGAPGYLTQADILNVLGNAATPRSDTFTIRGYGEARDDTGKVTASATCEAVVQRFPEWIDPVDPVETAPAALLSKANKTFGRRFFITSLRWLNSNEL